MILKLSLFTILIATLLVSCKSNTSKGAGKKDVSLEKNLLYTSEWKAVTDLLGSSYSPGKIAIADSLLQVDFTLKKKEAGEIVFIELVCSLNGNLGTSKGIGITYKCDKPLIIKLSQSDFGKDGDESYAHYQYIVPASETLTTLSLTFESFTQPDWTPEASKGKAMKLENVNAIYLTPNVDPTTGGDATLGVKGLYLL